MGPDDPGDVLPTRTGVEVTDLGGGRFRVTGLVTTSQAGDPSATPEEPRTAPFLCEVAPDPTDQLRGLKVTRLEVGPLR